MGQTTEGTSPDLSRMIVERVPPQSLDAEQSVLGAMILDSDAVSKAIGILGTGGFYREAHQRIFEACVEISKRGEGVDLTTVSEELKKKGNLEVVGGLVYLADLVSKVPTSAHVENYAKIVKDKAVRRQVIAAGAIMASEAFDESTDTASLVNKAEQKMFDLSGLAAKRNSISMFEMGPEVMSTYKKVQSGYHGILSKWPTMDDLTMGWQPEDFVLFAARLGIGKTATLLILAMRAFEQGKKILFVSPEHSTLKLAMRYYSFRMKLPYSDLRRGRLATMVEDGLQKTIDAEKSQKGFDIVGNDRAVTPADVESQIERLKPDIVFVDSVYLVKAPGFDRMERFANAVEEMKRIAKMRKVPVIAASQFNRDVKKGKLDADAGNLAMSDVAGWTADHIFALLQTDDMKADKKMLVRTLKSREGETNAEFHIHWDWDTANFDEIGKAGKPSFVDKDFGSGARDPNIPF